MYYDASLVDEYLDALEREIQGTYRGEKLKTIYIGGGTPSLLSYDQLSRLLRILSCLRQDEKVEYTIECNVESVTKEKLALLSQYGVNRLSFGIESTNPKLLQRIGRTHTMQQVLQVLQMAQELGFKNINVDLMYALPFETMEEVQQDLEELVKLPITHISTYGLILEEHTKFFIDQVPTIDSDLESSMYSLICAYLKDHGFEHYEISNFAKKGYPSRHNCNYWNNGEYYGFGLGAAGYLDHVRYSNTRSIHSYLLGKVRLEEEQLTKEDEMSYELLLGLRKIEGVSKEQFFNKYQKKMEEVFDYQHHLNDQTLIDEGGFVRIPEDQLYVSNEILLTFVGGSKDE